MSTGFTTRRELGKVGAWIFVLAGLSVVEKLPFGTALTLSLAHITVMSVAGSCVAAILSLRLPDSMADRLVLSYLAGWIALPLYILASLASGSHGLSALVVSGALMLGAALSYRIRHPRGPEYADAAGKPPVIPLAVYLFSSAYVLWSIAVPFGSFSERSICREFYSDGVQRFGIIHALADTVPPTNPFYAGASLRYYWFSLQPLAMEYRLLHSSLFDVWKCCQTWVAFFFLPGLWSIVQAVFGDRGVAWGALLLGFAFASYEVVGQAVGLAMSHMDNSSIGLGHWWAAMVDGLTRTDPDMFMGIVAPFSDQLFMEDFLYVIMNGYGLLTILLTLWLMEAGRRWAAVFSLSALMGINTFFVLPTFPAFLLATFMRYGLGTAVAAGFALFAYGCTWAALCQIIPGGLLVPSLILSGAATVFHAVKAGEDGVDAAVPGGSAFLWLKAAAICLVLSLLLMVLLKPVHNALSLFLNYAPALPIAVLFLVRIIFGGTPPVSRGGFSLLFLISACALYILISSFLALHAVDTIPAFLKDLSHRAGLEVERFNFHHKVGKLARLSWSILAGLGLAAVFKEGLHNKLGRSWVACIGIGLLALAALPTTLLRPATYRMECPVPEASAADYLEQKGAAMDTVVLIEDFRGSKISQLVPVSVYYYSQWTNGDAGVGGKWADQYLVPGLRLMSEKREANNEAFFDGAASVSFRAAILREGKIDYILTRKKYDFFPLAEMVVDSPESCLYAVRKDLP